MGFGLNIRAQYSGSIGERNIEKGTYQELDHQTEIKRQVVVEYLLLRKEGYKSKIEKVLNEKVIGTKKKNYPRGIAQWIKHFPGTQVARVQIQK